LRWWTIGPVEAGDFVGAVGAGAGHGFGPGADLEEVVFDGGLEKIDLVAAGDEDSPVLAEAGGGPAGGGRVLDGGLFEVGEEDGVVDVAEGVEFVEADADGEQEDAAGLSLCHRARPASVRRLDSDVPLLRPALPVPEAPFDSRVKMRRRMAMVEA